MAWPYENNRGGQHHPAANGRAQAPPSAGIRGQPHPHTDYWRSPYELRSNVRFPPPTPLMRPPGNVGPLIPNPGPPYRAFDHDRTPNFSTPRGAPWNRPGGLGGFGHSTVLDPQNYLALTETPIGNRDRTPEQQSALRAVRTRMRSETRPSEHSNTYRVNSLMESPQTPVTTMAAEASGTVKPVGKFVLTDPNYKPNFDHNREDEDGMASLAPGENAQDFMQRLILSLPKSLRHDTTSTTVSSPVMSTSLASSGSVSTSQLVNPHPISSSQVSSSGSVGVSVASTSHQVQVSQSTSMYRKEVQPRSPASVSTASSSGSGIRTSSSISVGKRYADTSSVPGDYNFGSASAATAVGQPHQAAAAPVISRGSGVGVSDGSLYSHDWRCSSYNPFGLVPPPVVSSVAPLISHPPPRMATSVGSALVDTNVQHPQVAAYMPPSGRSNHDPVSQSPQVQQPAIDPASLPGLFQKMQQWIDKSVSDRFEVDKHNQHFGGARPKQQGVSNRQAPNSQPAEHHQRFEAPYSQADVNSGHDMEKVVQAVLKQLGLDQNQYRSKAHHNHNGSDPGSEYSVHREPSHAQHASRSMLDNLRRSLEAKGPSDIIITDADRTVLQQHGVSERDLMGHDIQRAAIANMSNLPSIPLSQFVVNISPDTIKSFSGRIEDYEEFKASFRSYAQSVPVHQRLSLLKTKLSGVPYNLVSGCFGIDESSFGEAFSILDRKYDRPGALFQKLLSDLEGKMDVSISKSETRFAETVSDVRRLYNRILRTDPRRVTSLEGLCHRFVKCFPTEPLKFASKLMQREPENYTFASVLMIAESHAEYMDNHINTFGRDRSHSWNSQEGRGYVRGRVAAATDTPVTPLQNLPAQAPVREAPSVVLPHSVDSPCMPQYQSVSDLGSEQVSTSGTTGDEHDGSVFAAHDRSRFTNRGNSGEQRSFSRNRFAYDCNLCQENGHFSVSCEKQRQDLGDCVFKQGLCRLCYTPGHLSFKCPILMVSPAVPWKCQKLDCDKQPHHVNMCTYLKQS